MKFFAIASVFATAALAQDACGVVVDPDTSTVPATVRPIADGLIAINGSTVALNHSIDAYQGTPDQVTALKGASVALLSAIQDSTKTVSALAPLNSDNAFDALGLTTYVSSLACAVNSTVDNLIGKKELFVTSCEGPTVLDQLQQQQAGSSKLIDTTLSKITDDLRGLAGTLTQPILDSLAEGVAAFDDQTALPATCSTTTTASTGPTGTPGSTPTGSVPGGGSSTTTGAGSTPTGGSGPSGSGSGGVPCPTSTEEGGSYPTGGNGGGSYPTGGNGGGSYPTGGNGGGSYPTGGNGGGSYPTGGNGGGSYPTGGNGGGSYPTGGSGGSPGGGSYPSGGGSGGSGYDTTVAVVPPASTSSVPVQVIPGAAPSVAVNSFLAMVAAFAVALML